MKREQIIEKSKKLRAQGKTYKEIQELLNVKIPKSTLSYWCKDVYLPIEYKAKLKKLNLLNSEKGRAMALVVNKRIRDEYLKSVIDRNKGLKNVFKDKDVSKIALAMLYLGEGGKTQRGSLSFGNSDPFIISLFIFLMRYCYNIDEHKFRCTLQCRADQNTKILEKFWSDITNVSLDKFYKAKIDPRTIGKPTKKKEYKGVCRIDYFSADIFHDLMAIPKVIYKGP